ncbi:glycosyltransferase family 2 protein [Alteromonadaceae bacterium M269]|nr:glycosyltransferase family 2 protein [Alteromonadaceae bacterium M269]
MDYITWVFVLSNCILIFNLLVFFIKFKNKKNPVSLTNYPKVTIMVPFFNEPYDVMEKTLEAIEELSYPGIVSLHLIDDGSTNGCPKQVEEWLKQSRKWQYSLMRLPENTGAKGKAMDCALDFVDDNTQVVGVIDSDTCLRPNALTQSIDVLFSKESHAAVCGFVVPKRRPSLINSIQYFEHIGMFTAIKQVQDHFGMVSVMAGAFTLHKASVVKQLGGWGEWLVEDIAWTWKARARGHTTGYAPEAVADTVCPNTVVSLFKQRRRWARGRIEATKASWGISKLKTVMTLSLQYLHFQMALAPVFAVILLSASTFILGLSPFMMFMLVLNVLSFTLLSIITFLQLRSRLLLRLCQLPICLFINIIVGFLFLPATLIGIVDELVNTDKQWLTR